MFALRERIRACHKFAFHGDREALRALADARTTRLALCALVQPLPGGRHGLGRYELAIELRDLRIALRRRHRHEPFEVTRVALSGFLHRRLRRKRRRSRSLRGRAWIT